ncbi:hypothetical protein C8R44DRAFT_823011 [Mycena epipterygia]|nr:hypothetical protein C8R44DRAFT_823011 [Mycena epipterygia]
MPLRKPLATPPHGQSSPAAMSSQSTPFVASPQFLPSSAASPLSGTFLCDACMEPIPGASPRVHCLACPNHDLCANCALGEHFGAGHTAVHPTTTYRISGDHELPPAVSQAVISYTRIQSASGTGAVPSPAVSEPHSVSSGNASDGGTSPGGVGSFHDATPSSVSTGGTTAMSVSSAGAGHAAMHENSATSGGTASSGNASDGGTSPGGVGSFHDATPSSVSTGGTTAMSVFSAGAGHASKHENSATSGGTASSGNASDGGTSPGGVGSFHDATPSSVSTGGTTAMSVFSAGAGHASMHENSATSGGTTSQPDGWGPFFYMDMRPTPTYMTLINALFAYLDPARTGLLPPEAYSRILDDMGYAVHENVWKSNLTNTTATADAALKRAFDLFSIEHVLQARPAPPAPKFMQLLQGAGAGSTPMPLLTPRGLADVAAIDLLCDPTLAWPRLARVVQLYGLYAQEPYRRWGALPRGVLPTGPDARMVARLTGAQQAAVASAQQSVQAAAMSAQIQASANRAAVNAIGDTEYVYRYI